MRGNTLCGISRKKQAAAASPVLSQGAGKSALWQRWVSPKHVSKAGRCCSSTKPPNFLAGVGHCVKHFKGFCFWIVLIHMIHRYCHCVAVKMWHIVTGSLNRAYLRDSHLSREMQLKAVRSRHQHLPETIKVQLLLLTPVKVSLKRLSITDPLSLQHCSTATPSTSQPF